MAQGVGCGGMGVEGSGRAEKGVRVRSGLVGGWEWGRGGELWCEGGGGAALHLDGTTLTGRHWYQAPPAGERRAGADEVQRLGFK